jgi:hypothetical protein
MIHNREVDVMLTVPGVGVPACAGSAGGWAGPVLTTALAPEGLTRASSTAGSGAGSRRRGGASARGRWAGGRRRGSTGSRRGWAGSRASGRARVGRADGTKLDVGELDLGVGLLRLNIGGLARVGGAFTTGGTGGGRVGGVGRVEPEHVGFVIVPDGHDQNHTLGHRLVHGYVAVLGLEVVGITKDSLLLVAELSSDGGEGVNASNVGWGVLVDDAVLDVEAADLGEGTSVGTVSGDELGHDGELGVGVDGLASSVEAGVAHAVGVVVTAVLVADTLVALALTGITTVDAVAAVWTLLGATVGSVGVGDLVGLPDIHFIAARAIATLTGVGVAGRGVPSLDVRL